MRIIILLVIFKSVFFISSKADDWNYSLDSLELFQVKSDDLLLILDSIIKYEKQCVYYTPKLLFCIHPRIINDTIVIVQIGSFGTILTKSEMYKGCLEFEGHLFFVWGNEYGSILKNTKKKEPIYYYECKDDEIVVFEDDTYSIWIYYYYNENFIFIKRWDNYCNSLTQIN